MKTASQASIYTWGFTWRYDGGDKKYHFLQKVGHSSGVSTPVRNAVIALQMSSQTKTLSWMRSRPTNDHQSKCWDWAKMFLWDHWTISVVTRPRTKTVKQYSMPGVDETIEFVEVEAATRRRLLKKLKLMKVKYQQIRRFMSSPHKMMFKTNTLRQKTRTMKQAETCQPQTPKRNKTM